MQLWTSGMACLCWSQESACQQRYLTRSMTHSCRHPTNSVSSHTCNHAAIPYEVCQRQSNNSCTLTEKQVLLLSLFCTAHTLKGHYISDSLGFNSRYMACLQVNRQSFQPNHQSHSQQLHTASAGEVDSGELQAAMLCWRPGAPLYPTCDPSHSWAHRAARTCDQTHADWHGCWHGCPLCHRNQN